MVPPRLVILYEDSYGPLRPFPLHTLVTRSAADLCPLAVHEIQRRVIAVPKRGANKVLDDIARNNHLWAGGARVLAWLDDDRVRQALQLDPNCPRTVVIAAIKTRAPSIGHVIRPKAVEVFLLDDNLEALLSSIGHLLDPTLLAKAHKKHLDARDILLDKISRNQALRAALRTYHTGFDCVSRFVACVAALEPWPPR